MLTRPIKYRLTRPLSSGCGVGRGAPGCGLGAAGAAGSSVEPLMEGAILSVRREESGRHLRVCLWRVRAPAGPKWLATLGARRVNCATTLLGAWHP